MGDDASRSERTTGRPGRRRDPGAWRALGFIAVVTITALVGAWLPAGATETGGPVTAGASGTATARTVTSVRGWSVNLRTADGQRVPVVDLPDGRKVPQFVVGSSYRVSATVPPQVRAKTRTRSFALQHRAGADGEWATVKLLTMSRSGRLTDTFTVGPEMITLRDYRLVSATGPDAGYRLTSATVSRNAAVPAQAVADTTPTTAAPAPTTSTTTTTTMPTTTTTAGTATSTTVPATPSTTAPPNSLPAPPASDTFSAVANVQFAIQISNNSSNNMNLYLPSTQWNGTFQEAEISLATGETKTLLYNNPPPGVRFHLRVNKQKCFMGCTNYVVNWARPNDWKNWPSPCSAANTVPTFLSGQTYKVDLTDKSGSSDVLSVGTLTGELGGPGSGSTTCTFQLVNATDLDVNTWFKDNPVKGFLAAAAALYVMTIVVTVAVVSFGTAAPAEAAVLAEVTAEAGSEVAELAADDIISVTVAQTPDGAVNAAFIQPSVEVAEGAVDVAEAQTANFQYMWRY